MPFSADTTTFCIIEGAFIVATTDLAVALNLPPSSLAFIK
tara:strand:- start:3509 stop:3628 length:120 start_codon:yes stop_codon:yes gene_type:complete